MFCSYQTTYKHEKNRILTLCFLTNACSTMQGLGNDVQKAGSAISTSAERASEE